MGVLTFAHNTSILTSLLLGGVWRKALKDFVFSDGTFIPKGTLIGVATRSVHHDEKFYRNANVFQPFRFAGMHEDDGEDTKGQLVSTTMEYLAFGHGKHAWYDAPPLLCDVRLSNTCSFDSPGRFFAAIQLKSILAHIVVTYDVKLEDNATRPRSLHFGTSIVADPRASVLFRKRAK